MPRYPPKKKKKAPNIVQRYSYKHRLEPHDRRLVLHPCVSSTASIDLYWGSPALCLSSYMEHQVERRKLDSGASSLHSTGWAINSKLSAGDFGKRWVVKPGVEPGQERLIKVCKVCSAYLRDSNVPVDVKSAHPAFFWCLPTFPPPSPRRQHF